MKSIFLSLMFATSFSVLGFTQTKGYYPLNVGDYWQYWNNVNQEFVTREVLGDTTLQNGRTYAIVQNFFFPTIIFQRASGDSVFRFNTSNNQDELFYDLSASPGDTIFSAPNGPDTTDIILVWTHTQNIFGVDRQRWMFKIDRYRHIVDDEQFHVVADNLGLQSVSIIFSVEAELRGAILNGIQHGTITGVAKPVSGPINNLVLHQNYPNPFNSGTNIGYYLPQSADVRITIFDLTGAKVVQLLSKRQTPGERLIHWDGLDWHGSPASSGVYFYQLQTDNFLTIRKMLLIR